MTVIEEQMGLSKCSRKNRKKSKMRNKITHISRKMIWRG